ncbi:MAG: hypothetical protein KDA78_05905 [Planctomycetaceae bacterium]|nr:hypothetical protein [Planctomycetaceae bacterium]
MKTKLSTHLMWWFGILMLAGLLGIGSVWVPAFARKIGLFAIALGGLYGYLTVQMTKALGMQVLRFHVLVILLFALGMQGIRFAESYQSYRIVRKNHEEALEARLAELPIMTPELSAELKEELEVNFSLYLIEHYAALGIGKSETLAMTCLVLELLLGTGGACAGLLLAQRSGGRTSSRIPSAAASESGG